MPRRYERIIWRLQHFVASRRRWAKTSRGSSDKRLAFEKLADARRGVANFFFAQAWENRQREHFAGQGFGAGKIAALVAERREALLQVQRHRIINFAADTFFFEVLLQGIA